MLQKIMRRSDAIDKNVKHIRGELSGIGQKMNAHAVSIKNLELQMNQFSTSVNPCQFITLLSNTILNPTMMSISWKLLLEEVIKPSIHICRM